MVKFKINYNNSTIATIDSSGSWTKSTLNCKDKYMVSNITITPPPPPMLVGGRIYYDDGDNGATYTFYDANGNVISDTSISGLANAVSYNISGTPTKDRFYVFNNNLQTNKRWGKNGTSISGTLDGIGKGKVNTNICLATTGWESDSIFTYIQTWNTNNLNGCNDWYIASNAEQDKLKSSNLVNWYSSNHIWSSV